MADITSIKLEISGETITPDANTGAIEKEMTGPGKIKLQATVDPASISPNTWIWKKDGSKVSETPVGEYEFDYTDPDAGTYTVSAAPDDGTEKTSNRVVLKKKEAEAPPAPPDPAVAELEVGEYDGVFALVTGLVLLALTVFGMIRLADAVDITFPTHDAPLPKAISYLDRLRGFAVVIASFAGIAALGVGSWLAALEVRGRVRRGARPSGVVTQTRELKIPETLKAATKLRGTVAVLVTSVVLFCGALWTTGRSTGAPTDSPSPTPTITVLVTPTK